MSYISPEYPTDIPSYTDLRDVDDNVDDILASDHNDLMKELVSVLTELGTLPKGSFSDVKARLTAQSKIIKDTDGDTSLDTEESADTDTIVGKVAGVECLRFYTNGILSLPRQSAVSAYRDTAQTIPEATWTTFLYNLEYYDIRGEWSTLFGRFTPFTSGKYSVKASVLTDSIAWGTGHTAHISIWKNGSAYSVLNRWQCAAAATQFIHVYGSNDIYLTADDYIEIKVYFARGANTNTYAGGDYCWVSIHKLS